MYRRIARGKSKTNYTIFNPHDLPPLIGADHVVVTVIDPGITNAAIRQAVRCNRTKKVVTQLQIKVDFTHETLKREGPGSETSHYTSACRVLDSYAEYFQHSHYILVESQLTINPDMTRMGQHLISHLMNIIKNKGYRPLIVELDPHLKTRLLDCPPKMKKPQYKAWCRDKAVEILKERGDYETANLIETTSKGDDHGDVVCYEVVWWLMLDGKAGKEYIPPKPIERKEA